MREVASEVVVARAAAVRVVAARAAVVKAVAAKEASMAAMERAVVGRVEVAKKVASEMTARAAAARLAARAAAVEEPVRAAAGVVAHLERHCACAACLCASSGASQRHDAPHLLMLDRGVGSGRGLIRMGIIWAAWRNPERSTRPQRRVLWAGGRAGERLRIRTRCADGLRSPQVVHGAMGPEGTN